MDNLWRAVNRQPWLPRGRHVETRSSKVMHCTSPCVMLMNASEFILLHCLHQSRSISRIMLKFNKLYTTRIMLQNSKMFDFQHFSTCFENFQKFRGIVFSLLHPELFPLNFPRHELWTCLLYTSPSPRDRG